MITAASVLLGLLAAAGLLAAFSTIGGTRRNDEERQESATSPGVGRRRMLRVRTVVVAAAAGVVGWWVTGWPVAAPAVVAGVIGIPHVVAPSRAREVIALGDALASWTRRLADLLSSGAGGLEQALARSAANAPEPLAAAVHRLVARMPVVGTEATLRSFADEFADPLVDETVMTLILRVRAGGRGLADILAAQARSLDAEVTARREVEADRAKPRATVRALVGITAAMLAGLLVFAGDYLAPFATVTGQIVLALAALITAGALVWMYRLATIPRPTRYLAPAKEGDPS